MSIHHDDGQRRTALGQAVGVGHTTTGTLCWCWVAIQEHQMGRLGPVESEAVQPHRACVMQQQAEAAASRQGIISKSRTKVAQEQGKEH